jgi:3',5'-cyclic AMP phosphodiesterase CpdA
MTRPISILQLGDVHYPDLVKAQAPIDSLDSGVSADLLGRLGTTPIVAIATAVKKLMARPDMRAVLMMGDLTSRGDMDQYSKCVAYLERAFDLADPTKWHEKRAIVVPGNHDLPRRSKAGAVESQNEKFSEAIAAWKKFPDHVQFSVDAPLFWGLKLGAENIPIFPLNTCEGCGEFREINLAESSTLIDLAGSVPSEQYYDRLDAPFVSDVSIAAITDVIENFAPRTLSIVVGHHPILPQCTPRIAPYGEMLNAGRIRTALLKAKGTVLYLHGHIHEDPIDVLCGADGEGGTVICISAPLLQDGFNLLQLHLSEKTSKPLAIEVIPYRLEHGAIKHRPPRIIRLVRLSDMWNEMTAASEMIMQALGTPSTMLRFLHLQSETRLSDDVLSTELSTLRLLGLVCIENFEDKCALWQLRRLSN